MYSNKLVVCLLVDGKVVREHRDSDGTSVLIPFGKEYAVRLKNMDTRRAVVSVSIDGEDVLGGTQVVIDANSETDLKGFLDPSSNVARNSFKFIEKTEKISAHRGDKAADGLLRVEFQFEQPYIPSYRPSILRSKGWATKGSSRGLGPDRGGFYMSNSVGEGPQCFAGPERCSIKSGDSFVDNDQGITVAGSLVNQQFSTTSVGLLDPQKHAIVLQLKGRRSTGEEVDEPVLVRVKTCCCTCGTKNSSGNKHCGECGTCLI